MKKFAPRHIAVGVVLCGLGLALYVAAQPRLRAVQTKSCEVNLKRISLSMLQYVRDYDEHYPKSDNWMDALGPYARGFGANRESDAAVEARFRCPTTGSFYVYNRNLARISYVRADDPQTPWIYEAAPGQNRRNFSDSGQTWPREPIHQRSPIWGNHVLFGDAYVRLTKIKPNFRSFATPASKSPKIKPAQTAKP